LLLTCPFLKKGNWGYYDPTLAESTVFLGQLTGTSHVHAR
jgi:hypothetical protein